LVLLFDGILAAKVGQHLNQTVDLFHTLVQLRAVVVVQLVFLLVQGVKLFVHELDLALSLAYVGRTMAE
jgi:hypothetical protein